MSLYSKVNIYIMGKTCIVRDIFIWEYNIRIYEVRVYLYISKRGSIWGGGSIYINNKYSI